MRQSKTGLLVLFFLALGAGLARAGAFQELTSDSGLSPVAVPSARGVPAAQSAEFARTTQRVDRLADYPILTTTYDDMKGLSGFTDDETRNDPEHGLKVARIIEKRPFGALTITRFYFQNERLSRIMMFFHPPAEWPEERVKQAVATQWGDPGPKQPSEYAGVPTYQWTGTIGSIEIVPGDPNMHAAGYWIARLVARELP